MPTNKRGFTLVEMLVTIAVLGILAAVAFPNMQDYFDKQRLIGQSKAIADLVRFAKSEAIKSSGSGDVASKSVSLTVSSTAPWYVGLSNGSAACSGATCVTNESGSPVAHLLTATECTGCTLTLSTTSPAVISFDFRGVAKGATGQTITLTSPLGRSLSLSVGRLGGISVCSSSASVGGYPAC